MYEIRHKGAVITTAAIQDKAPLLT